MSVYNDMANDAGCRFGTEENQHLAAMIEAEEYRKFHEQLLEKKLQEEAEEEKQINPTELVINPRS